MNTVVHPMKTIWQMIPPRISRLATLFLSFFPQNLSFVVSQKDRLNQQIVLKDNPLFLLCQKIKRRTGPRINRVCWEALQVARLNAHRQDAASNDRLNAQTPRFFDKLRAF